MSAFMVSFRNLFLYRVPFYVLTITLLISLVATYYFSSMKSSNVSAAIQTTQNAGCITSMNIIRLKDYELTRPVLLADISRESEEFDNTKGSILDVISQQKQGGNVSSVSVYLRKFSDGSWTTINGEEQYAPGSLMKIPILITYLKQAESNSSLLDKQLVFLGHSANMPLQNFVEEPLIAGTKYSIRELLRRMIINSDNDATGLLGDDLNVAMVKKLFSDLNLREPNVDQKDYFITAIDCAKFLRILYNSSYLTHNMSEYALDLLTQSKFNKGMTKEIPSGIKVAHKFGESGITGNELQLHEEGIVYVENNPYLIVIMTKGRDFNKMGVCISSISNAVYSKFSGRNSN